MSPRLPNLLMYVCPKSKYLYKYVCITLTLECRGTLLITLWWNWIVIMKREKYENARNLNRVTKSVWNKAYGNLLKGFRNSVFRLKSRPRERTCQIFRALFLGVRTYYVQILQTKSKWKLVLFDLNPPVFSELNFEQKVMRRCSSTSTFTYP